MRAHTWKCEFGGQYTVKTQVGRQFCKEIQIHTATERNKRVQKADGKSLKSVQKLYFYTVFTQITEIKRSIPSQGDHNGWIISRQSQIEADTNKDLFRNKG